MSDITMNYVESLEARIAELEALLREAVDTNLDADMRADIRRRALAALDTREKPSSPEHGA